MDLEKKELYFQIATGKGAEALKDVRIKVGQGLAGWVAQTGEAVVVPDTTKDSRFFAQVDEKTKMATRSIVAVPVRFREQCLGVIELINCMGSGGFSQRDLALLEALADYAAIAIENARHVQRIHELTITDDCTTLYNARHLNFMLDTEIYRSHRYAFEFSLIFIDLDHFKMINDTHGHLMGSKLLSEIGAAIKDKCRLIDLAFRYGGDEFVLLLPQTSKENAMGVARRLHKLIRETVWLKESGINVHITASIGVASYPTDSRTKAELLHLADEAMYLVKNTTRDKVAAAGVGLLPHALRSRTAVVRFKPLTYTQLLSKRGDLQVRNQEAARYARWAAIAAGSDRVFRRRRLRAARDTGRPRASFRAPMLPAAVQQQSAEFRIFRRRAGPHNFHDSRLACHAIQGRKSRSSCKTSGSPSTAAMATATTTSTRASAATSRNRAASGAKGTFRLN